MKEAMSGQGGFTLIELLIALALLSLLVAYALSGIFILQKMDQLSAGADAQENADVVADFLRQSIEEMLPMIAPSPSGQGRIAFDGSGDRLRFLTLSAGLTETGGIYDVTLWREQDGRLLMARQLYRPGRLTPADPQLLLSGVNSLALTYSYCPGEQPSESLPREIRLDLTFAPDDQRRWHPLVALPGAVTCALPH